MGPPAPNGPAVSNKKKVPLTQWTWISATLPFRKSNFPGAIASIKSKRDVEVVVIVTVEQNIVSPYRTTIITPTGPVPNRKISSIDI
jgi:hypothetical protein